MSVAAKLAGFALVLVVCFVAAYGVGAAVGPLDDAPSTDGHTPTTAAPVGADHGGSEHGGAESDGGHGG